MATAPRYVAFLRAINVGGRVVKMERLRAIVAPLGFTDVATLIASGNVLFSAPARAAATAERRIEEALRTALGYEVETFVRPLTALAGVIAASPFGEGAPEGSTLQVGFVKALDAGAAARVAALASPADDVRVAGREVYWLRRTPISESKITGPRMERALGTPVTFRNVTTVRRLADMATDRSS